MLDGRLRDMFVPLTSRSAAEHPRIRKRPRLPPVVTSCRIRPRRACGNDCCANTSPRARLKTCEELAAGSGFAGLRDGRSLAYSVRTVPAGCWHARVLSRYGISATVEAGSCAVAGPLRTRAPEGVRPYGIPCGQHTGSIRAAYGTTEILLLPVDPVNFSSLRLQDATDADSSEVRRSD